MEFALELITEKGPSQAYISLSLFYHVSDYRNYLAETPFDLR